MRAMQDTLIRSAMRNGASTPAHNNTFHQRRAPHTEGYSPSQSPTGGGSCEEESEHAAVRGPLGRGFRHAKVCLSDACDASEQPNSPSPSSRGLRPIPPFIMNLMHLQVISSYKYDFFLLIIYVMLLLLSNVFMILYLFHFSS